MASKDNKLVKCLLCATSYCLYCLEKCVKYITKNAYIQVAITSKSFCPSAWNGFLLIIKNALRFGITHSVGCIFMFVGKLFIVCSTALVSYAILETWDYVGDQISTPYGPVFVVVVIAYVVGAVYMSVYSFASDAILQCFLYDEELAALANRPAGNRPPIMNSFIDDPRRKKTGCCC
mmetsp:Transcript_23391/g.23015  ORF Transcript_23391/g.23015 Transcript_23391/m.23015 type:complete len:177 (-) Transcript_23391:37-567(-)